MTATISGVSPDELRARQCRALNEVELDERLARAPAEPAEFDCECGHSRCTARFRLSAQAFATFRRSYSGFIVAPGHELPAESRRDRVDQMSESSFPASDPPAVWTWEPARAARSGSDEPEREHRVGDALEAGDVRPGR